MKYYITWQNGALLYWNGESWQASKEGAFIGFEDDCQQEIESNMLTRVKLEAAFYDAVGFATNQIFPS